MVLDAAGKVVYSWVGRGEDGNPHPGLLPDVTEIQAALGIGKANIA